MEKTALVVVDMVNDNVHTNEHASIAQEAKKIIPSLQELLAFARAQSIFVVYACDSFLPEDFIFTGKLGPHSLQGTRGAEVIPELAPQKGDFVLPKRRFSAFWKTGLETMLREREVKKVAVTGVSTPVCVLTTALDALAYDFKVVIISDCCAAHHPEVHTQLLEVYRHHKAFSPLLSIQTAAEFKKTSLGTR